MPKATVAHRIPFHDIDILGVAWHGHYLKYFELARTELMKNLGLDWPRLKELGIAMPVVNVDIRFKQVLNYDQELLITAKIDEYLYPEMKISYDIRDQKTARCLTIASTRQIYYDLKAESALFTVPEVILNILKETWGQ